MAPSRKRKRELEPESELDAHHSDSEQLTTRIEYNPDKEQDVWNSFRDEHFEAIEQVPLNLHRQYSLIHELDQQATAYSGILLPTILQYIKKRRSLKAVHLQATVLSQDDTIISVKTHEEQDLPEPETYTSTETHVTSQRLPTPSSLPPDLSKPAKTTRELLTRIACLADRLLRASEEKVNVAQAAYDTVDRHVRILQQAIKDQEASITFGARPGHLEPGNLSELTVGRWIKPSRATLSPINDDGFDESYDEVRDLTGDDPSEAFGRLEISSTKKGYGWRVKGLLQKVHDVDVAPTPLTITLPVPPPDEELFCKCRQPSFGEMIACDNKKCRYEWYHVGCVGLKETPPEGMKTWYCPDCTQARRSNKSRR